MCVVADVQRGYGETRIGGLGGCNSRQVAYYLYGCYMSGEQVQEGFPYPLQQCDQQ